MMKFLFGLSLLVFGLNAFSQTILFLGDSLTEGYQLAKEDAYPAVIEQTLKKNHPNIKVLNGGVSGATSASGLKRVDWYLKAKPDFIVIALGANDGLRGLKIANTEKNISDVIEKAQSRKMTVILAGMKMPTNYGEPYRSDFANLFPKLAKKYHVKLVPFILEGVGGNPKLNLADGIHPNPEGHKIMAQTILKVLGPLL